MITQSDARTVVDKAFCNGMITSIEADKRCKAIVEFTDNQPMLAYWLDDLGGEHSKDMMSRLGASAGEPRRIGGRA